ncbi:hypothetical protein ACFXKI_34695 [Streptomyces mirabilis]|uniref:hypothetical protein n=1 Tax=Streptomyces mirabilis TaxID=68239 RepID=UPI0036C05D5E
MPSSACPSKGATPYRVCTVGHLSISPQPAARSPQPAARSPQPAARSPQSGRPYAELVCGPLDGLLLGITGQTQDEIDTGVSLPTVFGQFGASGRAMYDARRFGWSGDSP